MVPLPHEAKPANRPEIVVSNVLARYSIKTTNTINVGSAVKTFEVQNTGNVACRKRPPCSPDGQWKAAIGSASLEAGDGNEFRNARTSCIAGPCPFTKIESEDYLQGGRLVKVSARNWSDTATFLVEAEVFRPMVADMVRTSHPVNFRPGAELYRARIGGRGQHSGRNQWRNHHIPVRAESLSELGRLQCAGQQRPDQSVSLRAQVGIQVPVGFRKPGAPLSCA